MECSSLFVLLLFLSWSFFIRDSHQLQSSQTQVLLQLRKQLEYPQELEIWKDHTVDFCILTPSKGVNITCESNSITELRIKGERIISKVSKFNGFPGQNQTLSGGFSMDSFVTTLSRLNTLKVLSLEGLGIWGPLSEKIHRLQSLEVLDLSSNYLFGSVPHKISSMQKLQTLTLDNNFFNETMPDWLDSLHSLEFVSFSKNQLKGELLGKFNHLGHLQHLDLSFNSLGGSPSAALFSLPNISYLNLSSNSLSGSLSAHLTCGRNLEFVDLSENKLTGDLPSCLGELSRTKTVKYDGNCLSKGLQNQKNVSYCEAEAESSKVEEPKRKNAAILVGIIAGISVVTVLLVVCFVIICRRHFFRGISEQHLLHKGAQDNSVAAVELLTNARYISQTAKVGTEGIPTCRSFSLDELREATNNFDYSAYMGEGRYGKLFKGRLADGTRVAVRCMPLSKKYTIRNLKLRLDLLAKLRHPHLVCLLGHCIDCSLGEDSNLNKVFLVYEYMTNGNLQARLSETSPEKIMKWPERLMILNGIAKAVHFLHTGVIPSFLDNRLKTKSILLNEHQLGKLSDYGLSIISDETETKVVNAEGLKSWKSMSFEDDIYCFGFIILELLVGPAVAARREEGLLNEMAWSQEGQRRVVDSNVLASSSQESLSVVISLMHKCISPDLLSRPSFEDVMWNLQYAVQVQAAADGEQKS